MSDKRRCLGCNRVVEDSRLVACPHCGGDLLQDDALPFTLSVQQEKKLLDALWRRLWKILVGGFSVLALISVLTLVLSLTHVYRTGMVRMESNLVTRIDVEFQQPRIQATVTSVASNQAATLLMTHVQPSIDTFKKETETQLKEVYDSTRQVQEIQKELVGVRENITVVTQEIMSALAPLQLAVSEVQDQQAFLLLSTRAQAYDRTSYTQLVAYASGTDDFATVAGAVISAVGGALDADRVSEFQQMKRMKLGDVTYSGPWTSDEIAELVGVFGNRVVADMIRKNNNALFVPTLVDMTRTEGNLLALNRITRALSQITGMEWEPFSLDSLYSWWDEHSNLYTNWPFDTYNAGIAALSSVRYQEAMTNFLAVVSVDKSADKSRALAAACAYELGDTDRASALLDEMADQNGQWAKWAQIKGLLATGDVDQATLSLHALVTNYPVLFQDTWMRRNSHLYRRLNWDLYEDLQENSGLRTHPREDN